MLFCFSAYIVVIFR